MTVPTRVFKSKADVLRYIVDNLEMMSCDYQMAETISEAMAMMGENIHVMIATADEKSKAGVVAMMTDTKKQVRCIKDVIELLNVMIADMRAHEALELMKGVKYNDLDRN